MSFNKTKSILFLLIFSSMLIAPIKLIHADLWQDAQNNGLDTIGSQAFGTQGDPADPRIVVAQIIKVILGILGILFVAIIVYAGIVYMLSQGNEEKVGKAIGLIKTGIIGLIIILAAYSIAVFVTNKIYGATSAEGGSYSGFIPF